jgi:hypothetical protein
MFSRSLRGLAVLCAVGCALAGTARGDVLSLFDRNSSLAVETSSDAGMYQWTVDGVNQLARQWFWYRIGPAGPQNVLESLGPCAYSFGQIDNDSNCNLLSVTYTGAVLKVKVGLWLTGVATGGSSDLAETLTITNTSASSITVHFYQYCDLDLGGTVLDSNVQIYGGNTADQYEAGVAASETVETPLPSFVQAGTASEILAVLTDPNAMNLSGAAGPTGSGDLAWGFQWDFSIGAGKSVLISKDKQIIIPEPGALILVAMGAVGLIRRRRAK